MRQTRETKFNDIVILERSCKNTLSVVN